MRAKEPQSSVVDLNECASIIAELFKPEARLQGVSLRTRLAADVPAVSGDAIQIQQVLLNLVRNGMDAVAAQPADGDELTITTELVDTGQVRCSVCDSGGKPEARLQGVSLRTRLAADVPAVSGDAIQIQQVLLNLVRNGMDAVAAQPADGDELTITTELVDTGQVRCSVCDSGVRLSDDKFDGLFEPFFTTKSGGLGWGLSVSRWIIEAHGGRISAARGAGGGAVFSFVLPIVRGDDHGGR